MGINLHLFGYTFPSSFTTIILLFLGLLIFYIYLTKKIRKFDPLNVKGTFEVLTEAYFQFFENMVRESLREEDVETLAPIIMLLFTSIFIGNATALIGLKEVAFNSVFPIVWGVFMFILWNGYAIWKIGTLGYLKTYFSPNFVFAPVEVIGALSKVLSITVRLIGNISAGVLIVGIVMMIPNALIQFLTTNLQPIVGVGLSLLLSVIVIPIVSALSFYFSLFSPLIQALVFSVLSLGNISVLLEEE